MSSQITLAWDPAGSPDAVGYKVYYGASSKAYNSSIDVGNVTSYTVTGLSVGQAYYFAATAYDAQGQESPYSNEVSANAEANCIYSLSSTGQSFDANGGTSTVSVITGSGCPWTALSPVSWITITAGRTGSGSGNVTYALSQNLSSASRSSTLTIAGLPFLLNQAQPVIESGNGGGTTAMPMESGSSDSGANIPVGGGGNSGASPLSAPGTAGVPAGSSSVTSGGGSGVGGEGGGGGSGCFIATAAFGSYVDPHVVVLRSFRDAFLLSSSPGRAFVNWYYATSPSLARFIQESEARRASVRVALIPLIGFSYLCLTLGLLPTLLLVVMAGVILVSAMASWKGHKPRG